MKTSVNLTRRTFVSTERQSQGEQNTSRCIHVSLTDCQQQIQWHTRLHGINSAHVADALSGYIASMAYPSKHKAFEFCSLMQGEKGADHWSREQKGTSNQFWRSFWLPDGRCRSATRQRSPMACRRYGSAHRLYGLSCVSRVQYACCNHPISHHWDSGCRLHQNPASWRA